MTIQSSNPDRVLIIAEAGVNHNGSLELAKALIKKASEAGADIVKFQTFKAEKLATKSAALAEYQKRNIGRTESQYEMLKGLELPHEWHHELMNECQKLGIAFLSTAFDFESLEFLKSLKLNMWKIPSGELTNYPFLVRIAKLNQRTILSTGMASMDEVEDAVRVLTTSGLDRNQLVLLHCNTEYPTPMIDVNLRAMVKLGEQFATGYGYSDHTQGLEVSIAAVALGARVIEKHFTLDRTMEGPDHKASLEPEELKDLVLAVRNIELALGSNEKVPSPSELKNRSIARKSLVAATKIKKGQALTEENLTVSRPGTGISPMRWPEVIGSLAEKDYEPGDLI